MKVLILTAALAISSLALANHHEAKKGEGHDVEHKHTTSNVDHAHADEHHTETPEQHKVHHPDHGGEATKKTETTTTTSKKK